MKSPLNPPMSHPCCVMPIRVVTPIFHTAPQKDVFTDASVMTGTTFISSYCEQVFDLLKLKTHTYDAFNRHARRYLQPAIIHTWNKWQGDAFDGLVHNGPVILGGDMRADSPG